MAHCTEVSVIHHFEFPEYCNELEISPNRETILGIGAYKPCMSVFDLVDHTQKLERNTDEESIKIAVLGEDWKKLALLHKNGKIEFHSQFGKYYTVDLPKECRDMKADLIQGEVVAAGAAQSLFRFSTVEGKFQTPIKLKNPGVESIGLNRVNSLYAICTQSGDCEFVDARSKSAVKHLRVGEGVTSCAFSDNGLCFSAGTENGSVLLYDLRSAAPLIEKDHRNGFPIKKIEICKKHVISMDQKGVKVWDRETGKTLAAVEPGFRASTFASDEGIVFIGGDHKSAKTYYVPDLGKLPKWCSYLEGSTDELLEIKKETFFQNYRFITEEQMEAMCLRKDVGKAVKPHMHGYLLPISLYEKKAYLLKEPHRTRK